MKKLIIGILAAFLLCGCRSENMKVSGEKTYCDDGAVIYARKFTFEEHQYIEFIRFRPSYDDYTGFVHDPNCWCMVDYE